LTQSQTWERAGELGFVVGATRGEHIGRVRELAPRSLLLIPGIGAQGGDLDDTLRRAVLPGAPALINVTRAIQYAGEGEDYDRLAGEAARQYAEQMLPRLEEILLA
jgi:orotidine-5'-phosphate decarboxylase